MPMNKEYPATLAEIFKTPANAGIAKNGGPN